MVECKGCGIEFDKIDSIPLCHACYCNEAQDPDSLLNELLKGNE